MAGNAALWAVGAVVVVGGGIGAFILLRPKEAQAATAGAEGGPSSGYGSGGPSTGANGAAEGAAYGGQAGTAQSTSVTAGVVNTPSPAPAGNAGSVTIARDISATGARSLATTTPASGLYGQDTTALAASRNKPPATPPQPKPTLINPGVQLKPAFREIDFGHVSPAKAGVSGGTFGTTIFQAAPAAVYRSAAPAGSVPAAAPPPPPPPTVVKATRTTTYGRL